MPKAIRTDNGSPFGVPSRDVVPLMSLRLVAWGIVPILNAPRRPTQNAKVERGQGTTSRWSEPAKCRGLAALQEALDGACLAQREKYRVRRLGNVTRGQLHPGLWGKARPFEEAVPNVQRAYDYLAMAVMPRKVSTSGLVYIYDKYFIVGKQHKGKIVVVKFSPSKAGWLVLEQSGTVCKFFPDDRFEEANLLI